MNNMFKKSLIAAALATVSTGAMAADLRTQTLPNQVGVSTEYVQLVDTVSAGAVTVVLGAEYAVGDIITLSFSGSALDATTAPTNINVPTVTGTTKSITLGLIDQDADKLVYRITDLGNTENTTVGAELVIEGTASGMLEFDAEAVAAAGSVNVSFSAQTSQGLNLDGSGGVARNVDLVVVSDQFTAKVERALNGVVNVEDGRESFVARDLIPVGVAADTAKDYLEVGIAEAQYPTGVADGEEAFDEVATVESVTYTVEGDFSWIKDSDEETAGLQQTAGTIAPANCATSEITELTASSITFTCSAIAANTQLVIDTAPQGGDVVLPTTGFTVSADVAYSVATSEGSTEVLAAANAGEWTLNGSEVNVSYMPYRGDISQVINLTNRSSQAGAVSVTAFPENGGEPIPLGEIATVDAKGITQIAGQIRDALSAETGVNHGTTPTTTRYSLEITTNAPAESIEVYSAYNVNGSGARLVVNDSNGGAISKQ